MRRSGIAIMARLVGLVAPLLHMVLLAVVLGTLGYLAAIAIPVLGAYALLDGLGQSAGLGLVAALVLLFLCALLRGGLRYGEQRLNHDIAFRLLACIRDKVFAALRRLCPAKLEGRDKGDLVSVITGDIELLEVFYAHTISPIAIALVTGTVLVVLLTRLHSALGVIAACGYLTVGVLLPLLFSRLGRSTGMAVRHGLGGLNGYFLESLRGLRETLQYAGGEGRRAEIGNQTEGLESRQRRLRAIEGMSTGVTGVVILLFSMGMLGMALHLYAFGRLSFGGLLIATVTMISSFGPFTALASLANNLFHTLAAGERVLSLLEECPQVEEVSGGKEIAFTGVACSKIDFSYGGAPVLHDLTATIPKGKIVGISGESGSGKSTLLRLLMRFWDPEGGQITLSDVDLRQVDTACLRETESFVTQDTILFRDTIENNIRIGKPHATRQEVEVAARKAALHDFIATLPKGYDTDVGELGGTLSGGERQRMGLARAFLHDAPLLLLDEPTSNLDSLNEGIILKSLREEGRGRTVVLVSHRASSLTIADLRLHMADGRVG